MVIIFHKSAAVKLHYTDIIVQLHKFENKSTKVCQNRYKCVPLEWKWTAVQMV